MTDVAGWLLPLVVSTSTTKALGVADQAVKIPRLIVPFAIY